jgi:hypothetical protein
MVCPVSIYWTLQNRTNIKKKTDVMVNISSFKQYAGFSLDYNYTLSLEGLSMETFRNSMPVFR